VLGAVRAEARRRARRRGERALARVVDGRPDESVERLLGSSLAQRAFFTGMAASFQPRMAFGFEGEIEYQLTSTGNGHEPERWTLEVRDGRAKVHHRPAREPAVTMRVATADLMRLAAGANPGVALLEGRVGVEGDLNVAMRLPEMFGAPSPY
jgi:hypothetical protein